MEVAEVKGSAELLTPDDVARRLNIGRALTYALVRRGTLPHVRVGRLLRIPAAALEAFVRGGGGGWTRP